jgi:hypothetical protein
MKRSRGQRGRDFGEAKLLALEGKEDHSQRSWAISRS